MADHFELDPTFIEVFKRSTEAAAVVRGAAEVVASRARQLVPVETGDLKDSIEVDSGIDEFGVLARVNANDYKAHWVEFGTVRREARPFLRPAAEELLGPFREEPGQ